MTCRQVLSRLSAFQDGECGDRITADIRSHLKGCRGCFSQLRNMEETVSRIRAISEVNPHPHSNARIMAGIKKKKSPKWLFRPSFVYPIVFVLCLVLGYAFAGTLDKVTVAKQEYETLSQILTENQNLALLTVQERTLALLTYGGPDED